MVFLGKRLQHIAVFRKADEKIYSLIYRDGRQGAIYAKRFRVGGVTRDKEYDLTKGTKGSRVLYLAVHDSDEESAVNGVVVHIKPGLRLRNLARPYVFGELAIKGRGVKGNLVSKHPVDRVVRMPKEAAEEISKEGSGKLNPDQNGELDLGIDDATAPSKAQKTKENKGFDEK